MKKPKTKPIKHVRKTKKMEKIEHTTVATHRINMHVASIGRGPAILFGCSCTVSLNHGIRGRTNSSLFPSLVAVVRDGTRVFSIKKQIINKYYII
jgi:hypothetical protein